MPRKKTAADSAADSADVIVISDDDAAPEPERSGAGGPARAGLGGDDVAPEPELFHFVGLGWKAPKWPRGVVPPGDAQAGPRGSRLPAGVGLGTAAGGAQAKLPGGVMRSPETLRSGGAAQAGLRDYQRSAGTQTLKDPYETETDSEPDDNRATEKSSVKRALEGAPEKLGVKRALGGAPGSDLGGAPGSDHLGGAPGSDVALGEGRSRNIHRLAWALLSLSRQRVGEPSASGGRARESSTSASQGVVCSAVERSSRSPSPDSALDPDWKMTRHVTHPTTGPTTRGSAVSNNIIQGRVVSISDKKSDGGWVRVEQDDDTEDDEGGELQTGTAAGEEKGGGFRTGTAAGGGKCGGLQTGTAVTPNPKP